MQAPLFPSCTPYSKTVRMKATPLVFIALTPFPVDHERERSILFPCLSVTHGYELSCSLRPACALRRWGRGKSSVCVYQARPVELIHVYIQAGKIFKFRWGMEGNCWSQLLRLRLKWQGNTLAIYNFTLENF